jgi:hypothetical protein
MLVLVSQELEALAQGSGDSLRRWQQRKRV